MIRHNDIAPDFPMFGMFPDFNKFGMKLIIGQDFPSVVRANGEMDDNGSIMLFDRWMACGMFSVGMVGVHAKIVLKSA